MTSKKLLFTLLLLGMFCSSQLAIASKVYYSCYGTNVTLSVAGSGYTGYLWKPLQGGSSVVTPTLTVTAPTTPSNSSLDFDTLKFTVEVQESANGCYSNPDTHLVVFLKPLNVVLPSDYSVCNNAWVNVVITPESATVLPSNLPVGISVSRDWSASNSGAGTAGANNANYTATTYGTYKLKQSYVGLISNNSYGGSVLSACATKEDEVVINSATIPTAPTVNFAAP